MVTTFKYGESKRLNSREGKVELTLEYSKPSHQLSPELYQELVALAKRIKEEFNREEDQ